MFLNTKNMLVANEAQAGLGRRSLGPRARGHRRGGRALRHGADHRAQPPSGDPTPSAQDGGFDYAVVDLNLHDQSAVPIAERLLEQGKLFVIATGYDGDIIPDRLDRIPRVEKPFEGPELLQLLQHLAN